MTREQQMVADFHQAFDALQSETPTVIDPDTRRLRLTLLYEELQEAEEAMHSGDLPAIAKELADLLYVVYGTAVSYAEVLRSAEALAGYLQQHCGVRRGDRVLLYTQNSPQFVIGYYAILRADAVVVPVNPMNKSEELAHYVGDSDARVAIAAQELFREIEPHLGKGLDQCVLASYSDFLLEKTDLKVPDFVRAPRLDPKHAEVSLWSDAIAAA